MFRKVPTVTRLAQVRTVDYQRHNALTCTDTPFERWHRVTVCESLADFLRTRQGRMEAHMERPQPDGGTGQGR